MKAKLVSTTNNRFNNIIGMTGELSIETVFYFRFDRGLNDYFHSSYIVETKQEDFLLTFYTRNSMYVFELQNEETVEPFKMSEEDLKEKEEKIRQSEFVYYGI